VDIGEMNRPPTIHDKDFRVGRCQVVMLFEESMKIAGGPKIEQDNGTDGIHLDVFSQVLVQHGIVCAGKQLVVDIVAAEHVRENPRGGNGVHVGIAQQQHRLSLFGSLTASCNLLVPEMPVIWEEQHYFGGGE
jgi:hypothetical protein